MSSNLNWIESDLDFLSEGLDMNHNLFGEMSSFEEENKTIGQDEIPTLSSFQSEPILLGKLLNSDSTCSGMIDDEEQIISFITEEASSQPMIEEEPNQDLPEFTPPPMGEHIVEDQEDVDTDRCPMNHPSYYSPYQILINELHEFTRQASYLPNNYSSYEMVVYDLWRITASRLRKAQSMNNNIETLLPPPTSLLQYPEIPSYPSPQTLTPIPSITPIPPITPIDSSPPTTRSTGTKESRNRYTLEHRKYLVILLHGMWGKYGKFDWGKVKEDMGRKCIGVDRYRDNNELRNMWLRVRKANFGQYAEINGNNYIYFA